MYHSSTLASSYTRVLTRESICPTALRCALVLSLSLFFDLFTVLRLFWLYTCDNCSFLSKSRQNHIVQLFTTPERSHHNCMVWIPIFSMVFSPIHIQGILFKTVFGLPIVEKRAGSNGDCTFLYTSWMEGIKSNKGSKFLRWTRILNFLLAIFLVKVMIHFVINPRDDIIFTFFLLLFLIVVFIPRSILISKDQKLRNLNIFFHGSNGYLDYIWFQRVKTHPVDHGL